MSGLRETNLNVLLGSLRPESAGEWAFCVVDKAVPVRANVLMSFREADGVTLIVPAESCEGLDVRFVGTRIDLNVESSLEAVGLTAAISSTLAAVGIAANVVAAANRDYVFVPTQHAEMAVTVLRNLAQQVVIRRAGIDDLPDLAPLFDAYRQFYLQPADLDAALDFLTLRMKNHESIVFVAEIAGEMVGFAQLYPLFTSVLLKRSYLLNDLYVAPAGRKRGIGTLLLEASEHFAMSQGAAALTLSTAVDNLTAQSVYEAAGWSRVTQFYAYRKSLTQR